MKNREKNQAEKLWAREKYLVLSKSQNIYLQIREYLKGDNIHLDVLREMIHQAKALPENRREVINALQHIWGYFKKAATEAEKSNFLQLLEEYRQEMTSKDGILLYLKEMLDRYPNEYLANSSIFEKYSD